MTYVSLYRKYRPQTFAGLRGQEHVAQTLANAIDEGRVAHAYLFTGPRGTGKTSTARILAKSLNCEQGPTSKPCGKCASCVAITEGSSLDVFEMDAASHSGVDDTREILSGVALATAGGRKKVYVIDEVHMLTTQSFNALLKTLEEPPDHVVFVLATTEAHKVLPTIVSRTQRFDFRRATADVLEAHIGDIAKQEGIDIDPDGIALLARHSEGSFRDALSALDQLSSFGHAVGQADVESLLGMRDEETFIELFDAVAASDVGAIFSAMQRFVAQGADVRQLADDALEHVRSLLLLKTAPDAEELLSTMATEDRTRLGIQAGAFSTETLLRTLDLIGQAVIEMRNAPNHRLLLEVALVRAAAPETDPSATGLQGRIERLERRIGIEGPVSAPEPTAQSGAARGAPTPPRLGSPGADAAPATPPVAKAPRRPPTKARTSAPDTTAGVGSAAEPQRASAGQQQKESSMRPEARERAPADGSASAAPEPQPVPGTAQSGVGLGALKDSWSAVLKEVNKVSKRVGAYLHASRPLRMEGEVLVVSTQSDFHARQMKEDKNRSVLGEGIYNALGIKPRVEFTHAGVEGAVVEEDAPAPVEDLKEAQDAVAVETEDPIELVKKGLGAEVVEERSKQGAS